MVPVFAILCGGQIRDIFYKQSASQTHKQAETRKHQMTVQVYSQHTTHIFLLTQAAICLNGRAREQRLQPRQQLARLRYGMQQMHHYHL